MRGRVLLLSLWMLALPGCAAVQDVLTRLDTPTASIRDVRFAGLSVDHASMVFDIEVSNPYSIPLPVIGIDYRLASGGEPVLTGQTVPDAAVPPGGSRVVALPVDVIFVELLRTLPRVRPGQVLPYQAELSLSVDAPGVGPLSLPLNRSGELPIPAVPRVSLPRVVVQSVSVRGAEALLRMEVENTNDFAVTLTELAYDLALGGAAVASSTLRRPTSFSAGQTHTLDIPVRLQPDAVLDLLRRPAASFDLAGQLQLDTRFGPLSLPYRQTGTTLLER